MRKVVCVDFDGTLCRSDFPRIIEPIPEAVCFVKEARYAGVALILWTCRTDRHLDEALRWCKIQGLKFDAVNENLPERIEAYKEWQPDVEPNGRKVSADLYIDDLALGGIEWDKAFDWLRRYGYQ